MALECTQEILVAGVEEGACRRAGRIVDEHLHRTSTGEEAVDLACERRAVIDIDSEESRVFRPG